VSNFDIPHDWTMRRLGELSSAIQYGYTAKAQEEKVGPKLLRITDIQDGAVDWDQVPFCKIEDSDKSKYVLTNGDLVFARTGATVGKSYLIKGAIPEALFASYLIRVRLREQIDSKYVSYFFKSPQYWRQISENQAGIGQPNVNGKKLSQLLVPVAPPDQQKRIVAEIEKQFSRLDEAVANLKRVKANLKRYKAAVLKAAVEGKLTEEWRKQHPDVEPASELLRRILAERRAKWSGKGKYKEPQAAEPAGPPRLPEGWNWVIIEQLSNVVRGASPRPAGDPKYFGGNIPWITVGPITADHNPYLKSVPETVTEAGRERSRYIEPETLLLTNSGATLGVPKITLIGGCINDGVAALLDVDYPLKLYLLYFLHSQTTRLRGVNQGAAQPNLNTAIIKAINVPLPPLAEQERIVSEVERRLSVVHELEAQISANLQRAECFRQSILHRAFEGKLLSPMFVEVPSDLLSAEDAREGA
jgi:type I restriction enzyme, S subunit